jgi:prepilin-type processing-associated H-X9-DG protein
MRRSWVWLWIALGCTPAAEPGSAAYAEGGEDAAEGDGDTASNADSDRAPNGDGDGDSDTTKFDTLPGPEASEVPATPCAVDILFVIDNSGSMADHKDKIVAAFASFITEMADILAPHTPVHVGVTRATGFFNPGNGSGWGQGYCNFSYVDGHWNPPTHANNGVNGQQGRLFDNLGQRYFEFVTGEDPAPLGVWFESTLFAAIQVDFASNTETVVAGAAYPFHPINAEYNAGFLREKAVLVLFLLSDAPDATPAAIPTSDFIAMVSDAKAECGDACVLPTGIIQNACYDKLLNANTRLTDFMNGFGAAPVALDFFKVNVPPESFTSVLGATLAESIAYTCEAIVPAG